jgi:beta-glucosidase
MNFEDKEFNDLLKTTGANFNWGVSSSALQTEGSHDSEGKGLSIWDVFSKQKKKINNGHHPYIAADFYNNYKTDIDLIADLKIPNFRTSISWPRIFPTGSGKINQEGVDFYNRMFDYCLAKNITPWITLYHWDLPYKLEQNGGWKNREIVNHFVDYVATCADLFGDRIVNWMVLNEPIVFTGAGYFLGVHAPGKKGLKNFLPALHHAAICQAQGIRVLKSQLKNSNVGTTFSFSHIESHSEKERDRKAALKADALVNRLFIEPLLGYGYPVKEIPFLRSIDNYMIAGDEKLLFQIPDFVGVQNYTKEVVQHSFFTPYLNAKIIPANKRNVPITTMQWEIYPESIYRILKKVADYRLIKSIVVTENGASFADEIVNGKINDHQRIHFLKNYLSMCLKAKAEGVPLDGYFVWSATDNFEWAEGYYPTFGLIHVDFETQNRIVKESGFWYKNVITKSL